tara:strand:- start:15 stop:704 length:690 start_codon:yes stop_codon:yes gene_type:complete
MADYLPDYEDIKDQPDLPLSSGQQDLFAKTFRNHSTGLVPVSGMVIPSSEWGFFDTNQVQSEAEKRLNGTKKKLAMDGYWPHPLNGRETDEEVFPSDKEALKDAGFFTEDWWEASGHYIYLGSGDHPTAEKVSDSLYDSEKEQSIFGPDGLSVPFSNAQDQQVNVISDFTLFNPQIYHDGLVGGTLKQPKNTDAKILPIRLPFVSDPIITVGGLNVYNQYGGFDAGFTG